MHINYLELLAAILAVKSFAQNKTRIYILLRIDNNTAEAYINHLGGTMERNIHNAAQYIPGSLNRLQISQPWGPTESKPFCYPPINLVPTLLQLVARSICRSNRCISPDMDAHEGVCQHTMEPGWEESIPSVDTADQHCPGNP